MFPSSITLWEFNIAIENGDLQLIYLLKVVMFNSYVSLPEGRSQLLLQFLVLMIPSPKVIFTNDSSQRIP